LNGTNIVLRLRADSYPTETLVQFIWSNQAINSNSTPLVVLVGPDKFNTQLLEYCVPEGDWCGELAIMDKGGDGFLPPGGYDLFVNGKVNITGGPFTKCTSIFMENCFERPNIYTSTTRCPLCEGGGSMPDSGVFVPSNPLFWDASFTFDKCAVLDNNTKQLLHDKEPRCGHIQATFGDPCKCKISKHLEQRTCRLCGDNMKIPETKKLKIANWNTCLHYKMNALTCGMWHVACGM
jgi:hypothetical protein